MGDNIVFAANQRVAGERKIGRGPRDAASGTHKHHLWGVPVSSLQVAITGTTSETSMGIVTIDRSEPVVGDSILIRFNGYFTNNTGADRTLQLRGKVGSGTLLNHTSIALSTSASPRPVSFETTLLIYSNTFSGGFVYLYAETFSHLLIGAPCTSSTSVAVADQAVHHNEVTMQLTPSTPLEFLATLSSASAALTGILRYHRL